MLLWILRRPLLLLRVLPLRVELLSLDLLSRLVLRLESLERRLGLALCDIGLSVCLGQTRRGSSHVC